MPATPPRRFDLLDLAILVAVAAISASWMSRNDGSLTMLTWAQGSHGQIHGTAWWVQFNANRLAIACTLGVLAMRLRRPQPSRARLWRQPGLVAVAAATIALAINFVSACFYPRMTGFTASGRFAYLFWNADGKTAQAAAAWAVLAASRRWRPEPGWIDRAGRAVGLAWLALLVAERYFLATR